MPATDHGVQRPAPSASRCVLARDAGTCDPEARCDIFIDDYALVSVRSPAPAEAQLLQLDPMPGYPIALLRLVQEPAVDVLTRQGAAITFKNFIRRRWVRSRPLTSDRCISRLARP